MTVPGIVRRRVSARLEDSAPSWAASRREKPPCRLVARGAAVCTMAWGAGRCATGGLGGVTRAVRLRFFAGCRLARGRSAPRRLPRCGSPPFARCGPVFLDFSRSIIQQQHKNGVVNLDHRFTPYSQFFVKLSSQLIRTSRRQVCASSSGVQQGGGVRQRPWQNLQICALLVADSHRMKSLAAAG